MNSYISEFEMLFMGVDAILSGIVLPIILSAFASLVQVALFGWQGIKNYAANFCISMYMALLTHWALAQYDMSGEYKTIIISFASLTSFQTLKFFVSKKFFLILLSLLGRRIQQTVSNWLGIKLPDVKISDLENVNAANITHENNETTQNK